MKRQSTDTLLMVEPIAFSFNIETAKNNYFQTNALTDTKEAQARALDEFNAMVEKLKSKGIRVITIKDTIDSITPDSIFPNNWISMHQDSKVALYPMFAENRRLERREDVLDILENEGFSISEVIDYTSAEEENVFLEGTGSMILDRVNRLAYAALSERTDEGLLIEFCEDFEYTPIVFIANHTVAGIRKPIYHTNVMMCIADKYAIIALDTIDDASEKKFVAETIKNSGKELIEITEDQILNFAGNMLQVSNGDKNYLVMSQSAYDTLTSDQIKRIEKYDEILSVSIPTIETLGGGSARCMMAEVFLPKVGE